MKKHLRRMICCGLTAVFMLAAVTPVCAAVTPSQEIVDGSDITPAVPSDEPVVPQPLGAPVIKSVAVVPEGLLLNWEEQADAQGYIICRSLEKKKGYKRVGVVGEQTISWIDTTVEPGTKYYYKLRAFRKIDGKKEESPRSKAASRWTPSPAPQLVTASQDGTAVRISWEPSKAATLYRVYRAPAGSDSYKKIATKLKDCTYLDDTVAAGETYSYKVVAVHGSLLSARSEEAVIRVGNIATNTRTLLLGPGVSAQLTATSDLEGELTWTSEDESIVRVGMDGMAEGISPGVTNITASIAGAVATVKVTVTDSPVNGIDVSHWQQDINWTTVKASGVKFAMLRLAYSKSKDRKFEDYYLGATKAGIPVGVYCYSMAKSVEDGIDEALNLVEELDGRELIYPVALDLEDGSLLRNLSQKKRAELIVAYKQIIEDAGYRFVLYANLNWLNNYVDQQVLADNNVDIWIARYRDQSTGHGYTGNGNVRLWQYSDKGQIDGILTSTGKYINVDLDVNYDEYF